MQEKKKALKYLGIFIALELAIVILVVYLFDPFYQYHGPWFGLQQVLYDRDNQMMGSIRNLSYDSVLLGSSVAENFDSTTIDAIYDCHTLKIIRASGSVADLLYYLKVAQERQQLKEVFWCMDIFALTASGEVTLYAEDIPRYLHTSTMLDDVPYVLNKEILFVKIPLMLAYSVMGINTGGHAYDWSRDKEFSAQKARQAYQRPAQALEPQPILQEAENIEENISRILEEIKGHPDTDYTIVFPPYSMLWWDCGYTNGIVQTYFLALEKVIPALLSCDNVVIYFFMSEEDIICNLDNYMDMVHYSPQINAYMLERIEEGNNRVTSENMHETMKQMHNTYEYIIEQGIYE